MIYTVMLADFNYFVYVEERTAKLFLIKINGLSFVIHALGFDPLDHVLFSILDERIERWRQEFH